MRTARVVVVVVSASMLCDDALMTAIEQAAMGGRRIVPYIARSCTWQETFLGQKQALPTEGHLAAAGIRTALEKIPR